MKPMQLFYGCPVATAAGTVEPDELRAVLEVMRPKPSPVPLIRVGGNGDGGYLMPDDFDGLTACFSPGVNNFKNFEDELTDKFGIACHLCDLSSDVERFRTPLREQQTFRKVWLEPTDGDTSVSLATWIAELAPDPAHDLLLQMDIEGAEYRNLLAAPDWVMQRFRIIVLEVHSLERLTDPGVFHGILKPVLAKLDATHVCVHAHPNNCCGTVELPTVGMRMPRVHELTFLRRDRVAPGATLIPPELPHALDVGRNVGEKAPIFLDESWLGRPRNTAESLRMAREELAFVRERRKAEADEAASIIAVTRASAEAMARAATRAADPPPDLLVDVALGKPFMAGGPARREWQPTGTVRPGEPAFFSTRVRIGPFITIDLGAPHEIHRVILRNRTDRHSGRARHLFLALHDEPARGDVPGIPVAAPPGFAEGRAPVFEMPLTPTRARYVTLYSAASTALHLAGIEIFARPEPAPAAEPGSVP